MAKVKQDTTLQGKLKAASDGNSAIAIANEAGFPITAEDIDSHSTELSTKELESAVGIVMFRLIKAICKILI
ncbi:MAG: Nif11-like leader peptide family natural product precursor [Prochlorococcus sp.]